VQSFAGCRCAMAGAMRMFALLSITARAEVSIQNTDPEDLTFTSEDVDNATIKRSSTHSLTEALASSLLRSADIRIKALGVSSPLVTKNNLLNLLSPVAGALDPTLFEILDVLGVKVGEADVLVRGIKCGNSNLAGIGEARSSGNPRSLPSKRFRRADRKC
jgi:uncharacterized membrane protein